MTPPRRRGPRVVFVTGPSGAGRTTAINALEDLGFEAIDNLPLSLLPRLLEGPPPDRADGAGHGRTQQGLFRQAPALGITSVCRRRRGLEADLLYLDCEPLTLQRRYSETRRRHPLAPDDDPANGHRAASSTCWVRCGAAPSVLVDTTHAVPPRVAQGNGAAFRGARRRETVGHDHLVFVPARPAHGGPISSSTVGFSAIPTGEPELRPLDGRDPAVRDYIEADPTFAAFETQVSGMLDLLLPAFRGQRPQPPDHRLRLYRRKAQVRRDDGKSSPLTLRRAGWAGVLKGTGKWISGAQASEPEHRRRPVQRGLKGQTEVIGIVIVAHGGLAAELKRATEHVVGPQVGLVAISVGPEDDRSARTAEICQAADGVDTGGRGRRRDRYVRWIALKPEPQGVPPVEPPHPDGG